MSDYTTGCIVGLVTYEPFGQCTIADAIFVEVEKAVVGEWSAQD